MKKILTILSTVSSFIIISINIISCQQSNTNNEIKKPIKSKFIPQQPPENSNWKSIYKSNFKNEFNIYNNKWYFFIWYQNDNYVNDLIKNSNYINFNLIKVIIKETNLVYCWNGVGEPETPTINKDTGEITNWNE